MGYEALGLSSRVRRAASSLQVQSHEAAVASYGLTETAPLNMLPASAKYGCHATDGPYEWGE